MTKRKLIWSILFLFSAWLFLEGIPNDMYNTAPVLIGCIGAGLCLFLLAQAIADFRSWDEFNTKDKERHDWRHRLIPWLVLPGIALAVFFPMYFYGRETNELKTYGQQVTGLITNGSATTNVRGGGIYNVTVQFTTKDGKLMSVEESVSKEEFDGLAKGEEVQLVYSTRNPDMIRLLLGDSEARELSGTEERSLTVQDLASLLPLNQDSVGHCLRAISSGWTSKEREDGSLEWVNSRKNVMLATAQGKHVAYVSMNSDALGFAYLLMQNGFKRSAATADSTEEKAKGREVFIKGDTVAIYTRSVSESGGCMARYTLA